MKSKQTEWEDKIPIIWFCRHSRPKSLRCLFILMQGNVLKARSSAVFQATSLRNFFDAEFTIEIRLCRTSLMQGDWSREQTLIHWILSWISFSNRFKQTKLTLDFSQWVSDGLYSNDFLGRSITCKLFFFLLLGDLAPATWYLSLPVVELTCFVLYHCARTRKTTYFEHLKEQ